MKEYLPTLDDCELIVENNSTFKRKEEIIEGKRVIQFSYLLAKHNDFSNPIEGSSLTAEELRGITFVEQPDNTFKRFLMIPKFFNLNQVENTLFHNVCNQEVKLVSNKLDGSMITFVPIGDIVLPKTKFSFFNDQTKMASDVYYSNKATKEFIDTCLQFDHFPIFELVSPQNQIVLPYSSTELRLIQLRKSDGSFKDIYSKDFQEKWKSLQIAEQENYSLDELVLLAETIEDKEGWVVQLESIMLKVKTKWYFEKHRLVTGDASVEHKIIEFTLNETIDDVLSQIPEDAFELRNFIDTISDNISKYVDNRVNIIWTTYNNIHTALYNTEEVLSKKLFVEYSKKYHNTYFKELMYLYNESEKNEFESNDMELFEKFIIKDTINKTNALQKARKFLNEIGVQTSFRKVEED